MNDECERKWKTPEGKSPARTLLVSIHGGRGRHYADDVEEMYRDDFRDKYDGEDWWHDSYVPIKRQFMEKCNKNPHARFHNHGGARTRRSKKNRKTRKTRK